MLMTCAKHSLQYEEQARQSCKRIQRAQHQSMVCQSIAVLLLVNLSIAQADKLPSEIYPCLHCLHCTSLRRQHNTALHPAQATPAHSMDL